MIHALAQHEKLPEKAEAFQACLEANKARLQHFERKDALDWIAKLPEEMLSEHLANPNIVVNHAALSESFQQKI